MRYSIALVTAAFALLAPAAPVVQAASYNVCGKGRVVWPDDSTFKPLIGARVYLMDDDLGLDDELTSGYTDADGRFHLCGSGTDAYFCPFNKSWCKPDIYVKVELENSDITIENEIFINRYAETPNFNNAVGTRDFGTFAFEEGNARDATVIFAKVREAYEYFKQQIGSRIPDYGGRVRVKFPAYAANGTPWTSDESIHWPNGFRHFKSAYHEFGHRIRHAQDGGFAHFLIDVVRFGYARNHYPELFTNEGFAFNEGWAHYFSTLLDPDERQFFLAWKPQDHTGGDAVEGNVAQKILRLSENCGGFKKMWPALASKSMHSFKEFESAVKTRDPACEAPIMIGGLLPGAFSKRAAVALDKQTQAAARSRAATVKRLNARMTLLRDRNREIAKALPGVAAPALLKLQQLRGEKRIELLGSIQRAFVQADAAIKPISPKSIADKSFDRNRADVRAGFVRQVVAAWKKSIADTRKGIAQARAAAKSAEEKAFLAEVERKQKVIEGHLRLAETSGRLPIHLLPVELAARTAEAK